MAITRAQQTRQLRRRGGIMGSNAGSMLVTPTLDGSRPGYYGPDGGFATEDDNYQTSAVDYGGVQGISDRDAENLLIADLQIAAEGASNVISEFGSGDFDALCQNCQEIFTDFVFNLGSGGLRKFPKFVAATLDHDTEVMHQEYKRYYRDGYGELKELEHRNAEFAKMFF